MRYIIKGIGLVSLICFSFFYTEQVINVVNEQDVIMIKINDVKDQYKKEPINAIIEDNTIIPGINGREVNVDKSYADMKQVGIFKEMLLSYKDIIVKDNLANNYDKYIVKGNNVRKNVSLVMVVTSKFDIENISNIDSTYLNLFVDAKLLASNLNSFKKDNFSVYSYGNNGVYNDDILLYSNNLINRNFSNKSLYCLVKKTDNEVLNTCKNSNMHTIIPSIFDNNNTYNNIKNDIENGSIIKLDVTSKTMNELDRIVSFITSKGYRIVSLDELLSEKC